MRLATSFDTPMSFHIVERGRTEIDISHVQSLPLSIGLGPVNRESRAGNGAQLNREGSSVPAIPSVAFSLEIFEIMWYLIHGFYFARLSIDNRVQVILSIAKARKAEV